MKITKGTRAFLTGAGSGIGRASAIELAELGCELFLTDINARGLEETRGMISDKPGRVCKSRAFDIRDLSAVKAFADEIHQEFGPMDIVMNIAGIALFAQIEDMTHQHWEKVIGVNLWGPIHCIECFLPEMIRVKKGHLVNVASIAGLTGAPWHAAYSTSKWGLAGLSEVLSNLLWSISPYHQSFNSLLNLSFSQPESVVGLCQNLALSIVIFSV